MEFVLSLAKVIKSSESAKLFCKKYIANSKFVTIIYAYFLLWQAAKPSGAHWFLVQFLVLFHIPCLYVTRIVWKSRNLLVASLLLVFCQKDDAKHLA